MKLYRFYETKYLPRVIDEVIEEIIAETYEEAMKKFWAKTGIHPVQNQIGVEEFQIVDDL